MKVRRIVQGLRRLLRWTGSTRLRAGGRQRAESLEAQIKRGLLSVTLYELPDGMLLPYDAAQYIGLCIEESYITRMRCIVVRRPRAAFPEGADCIRSLYLFGVLVSRETLQWPRTYNEGRCSCLVRQYLQDGQGGGRGSANAEGV